MDDISLRQLVFTGRTVRILCVEIVQITATTATGVFACVSAVEKVDKLIFVQKWISGALVSVIQARDTSGRFQGSVSNK